MTRSFIATLGLSQIIGLALLAWASQAFGRESAAANRMDVRRDSSVVLAGDLRCEMPAQNTGAACRLIFQASNSGRTLEITGRARGNAMRLYADGKTAVAIEGVVRGAYFNAERIQSL